MASESEIPAILDKIQSQITIGPSSDQKVHVTSYFYSKPLPTFNDVDTSGSLTSTRIDVMDLAAAQYNGNELPVEPNSTCLPSACCSVMIFDTKGDWVVSFALQVYCLGTSREILDRQIDERVKLLLSNVKWNDCQMIPINSTDDTAIQLPDGFEKAIGEEEETKIKKWMEETNLNIHKALQQEKDHDTVMAGLSYNAVACMFGRRVQS